MRGSQRLCPLRVPIPTLLRGQHDQGLQERQQWGAEWRVRGCVASSAASGWCRQHGSPMSLPPLTRSRWTSLVTVFSAWGRVTCESQMSPSRAGCSVPHLAPPSCSAPGLPQPTLGSICADHRLFASEGPLQSLCFQRLETGLSCPELGGGRRCSSRFPSASQVCGSDGVTYGDQCQLKTIACRQGQVITVKHVGQCHGECLLLAVLGQRQLSGCLPLQFLTVP